MDIALNEVVYFDFITTNPATGAAVDADSTPTFAVYEESTDTDIGVGGNATKRTSLTGNYRLSFTCSAANGFELGKWYSVIASATVSSVSAKNVVKNFRISGAEATAGFPVVEASYITATTATNIKKNTAFSYFKFVMTDSTDHTLKSGLTVTATRSIDDGAFAACTNAVSELSGGVYKINLSAADLNGNDIMLKFTATGADDCPIKIVTQP